MIKGKLNLKIMVVSQFIKKVGHLPNFVKIVIFNLDENIIQCI